MPPNRLPESAKAQEPGVSAPSSASAWADNGSIRPGGLTTSLNGGESIGDAISDSGESRPRRTSAEELLEIYQRECGPLPAAADLTPERRRQCALRIRAGLGSQEFDAAVRHAAATPFLAGQGARGWRASFDWFIANDTNVRKVNEGVYEPSASPAPAQVGFALRERERALYSELHVGTGPVAADYGARVKPEAIERIRARQQDGGRRPP